MQLLVGLVPIIAAVSVTLWRHYRRIPNASRVASDSLIKFTSSGLALYLSRFLGQRLVSRLSLVRYGRIRLAGTSNQLRVPGAQEKTLSLDDIYVSTRLIDEAGERITSEQLLDLRGVAVILGDPGAGKTSTVNWLFRRACETCVRTPMRARLPIRQELKSLDIPVDVDKTEMGQWLLNEIRAQVARVSTHDPEYMFDTLVRSRGIIVFLDGLDEVAISKADRITHSLRELASLLADLSSNNALLVTSRHQMYDSVKGRQSLGVGRRFSLLGLSEVEVERMIVRWPFENPNITSVQVLAHLSSAGRLRSLVSNPLFLAMYLSHADYSSDWVSQETSTAFLRQVVSELLDARRRRQKLADYGSIASKERREAFLSEVAIRHLLDVEQAVNIVSFVTVLEAGRCLAEERNDYFSNEDLTSTALARSIALDTGLLTLVADGKDEVHFMSTALLEYFAATAVSDSTALWTRVLDATQSGSDQINLRFENVIIISMALLRGRVRRQRARDLTGMGKTDLLLRAAAESQDYNMPGVGPAVLQQFRNVTEAKQLGDPSYLESALDLATIVTDARRVATSLGDEVPFPEVDLVDVFCQIASDSSNGCEMVFSALAKRDIDEAVQFLKRYSIGARDVNLVADNVMPDAFVAAALAHVSDANDSDNEYWARLLCDVALSRPSVARTLLEEPSAAFPGMPRSSSWTSCPALRGSAYGYILDRALSAPQGKVTYLEGMKLSAADKLTLLRCLGGPPSFAREVFLSLARVRPILTLVITIVTLSASMILPGAPKLVLLTVGGLLASCLFVSVCLTVLSRVRRRSLLFQMLNLAPKTFFAETLFASSFGLKLSLPIPNSTFVANEFEAFEVDVPKNWAENALVIALGLIGIVFVAILFVVFDWPISRYTKIAGLTNSIDFTSSRSDKLGNIPFWYEVNVVGMRRGKVVFDSVQGAPVGGI